eukprot:GAHX01002907.1.p1 GENE.GAHX01002907.1~~GAHX01002907.1.p1  ORF type:complete len:224 (+),score=47.54 GAHX01002907.1:331-1002(+)
MSGSFPSLYSTKINKYKHSSRINWFTIYFVSVLIISSIITIIYFPSNKSTTLKTEISSVTEPTEFTSTISTSSTSKYKARENSNTLKLNSSNFIDTINSFQLKIENLKNKTYSLKDKQKENDFDDKLVQFMKQISSDFTHVVSTLKDKENEIFDMFNSIQSESNTQNKVFIYYTIVVKYSELLLKTRELYDDDVKIFQTFTDPNDEKTLFIFLFFSKYFLKSI